MRSNPRTLALVFAATLAWQVHARETTKNGFDLSHATIPSAEIHAGGPPRDGIPALVRPDSLAAADARWPADTVVIGVSIAGQARAYPIAILDWHELVNDELGGAAILVSYCPLCGTGIVFDRGTGDGVREFGVSGLLYQSDMLLYDRETESLWSQILGRAVAGPLRGERLRVLRATQTRWDEWRARHPESTVLSPKTGHRRDYGRTPYAGYATSKDLYFPAPRDSRYHPKMPTLGVRAVDGAARAYPAEELERAGGRVRETFAGHDVTVAYDAEKQVFRFEIPDKLEVIEGYWFAWAAFHPDTTVFRAPAAPGD